MSESETFRAYRERIEALHDALARMTADRDRLAARMERLQTHHDNVAAMRCANPSCQLCQLEMDV